MIWLNSENNTNEVKKLTCVSHSISMNYGNTFVNYCNTFAYLCVKCNTFGGRLNWPESAIKLSGLQPQALLNCRASISGLWHLKQSKTSTWYCCFTFEVALLLNFCCWPKRGHFPSIRLLLLIQASSSCDSNWAVFNYPKNRFCLYYWQFAICY